MADHGSPDPADRPGLTAREQAVLARIEQDLTADSALKQKMSVRRVQIGLSSPVSLLQGLVLVLLLVGLSVSTIVLPGVLIPALTVLTIAPWFVWAAWPAAGDTGSFADEEASTRSAAG